MTRNLICTALLFAACAAAETPGAVADERVRSVHAAGFTASWSTGADTESLTSFSWRGGPNLVGAISSGVCDATYFGGAFSPADAAGESVVVAGGGSAAPAGTQPFLTRLLPGGEAEVTINSHAANCPPASAGIDVQTTYRFLDANRVVIERVFDFSAGFPHDLRPYIPLFSQTSGLNEVVYPTIGGGIQEVQPPACGAGCTGPKGAAGAVALEQAWDANQNWFALLNRATMQGVIVERARSNDTEGQPVEAQLWVDRGSSFLLRAPVDAFRGLLPETETLCFYDSGAWIPSAKLPAHCQSAPVVLSPANLEFPAQHTGTASEPRLARIINTGSQAVELSAITAGGDFTESNDCPKSLPAGRSCTVQVVFTPGGAGIRSGLVSIQSTGPAMPRMLAVAGRGED